MSDEMHEVLTGERRWCVIEGDALEVLRALPAASIDALVTDPPSGIAFMGAEWDRDRGGRTQWVAWLASILAAARAACVDGARAAVWALPRTSHWTGCAVEDAGWSIENCGAHLFGTGWPKGRGQLKPAMEHWWFARTGASTALNIDECRVGTSKRVPGSVSTSQHESLFSGRKGETGDEDGHNPNVGRYPPNLLLSHALGCQCVGVRKIRGDARQGGGSRPGGFGDVGSDSGDGVPCGRGHADADGLETVDDWQCVDGCPVALIDEQSGTSKSTDRPRFNSARPVTTSKGADHAHVTGGFSDSGGASRFYPQFQHGPDEAPFLYCAKPHGVERNAGLAEAGLPEIVCKTGLSGDMPINQAGQHRDRTYKTARNHHPTVKPVALMRWLIRLTTKPGDIVLDPFTGSGTTGVAALLEGRRFIGVERDAEFAAIARARMEHATSLVESGRHTQEKREKPKRVRQPSRPTVSRSTRVENVAKAAGEHPQLSLFGEVTRVG